ncbi:MAG: xanthine dehydrogenase family protein molybdopterin-binding subunit [Pseudomonadota bacterium]
MSALSRRRFLRNTGIAGGGLVVGVSLSGCGTDMALPIARLDDAFVADAFVQITPENAVRFYCARDEMGQGVTTGLATLMGEELDIDPAVMDVQFPGAHPAYANPGMGVQGTGGSNSIAAHWLPLRQAGANVRAVILDAAAADLGVARESLATEDGHVIAGGERHPYGRFVATAKTLDMPTEAPLKTPAEFRYIGKELPRIDSIAKATGTAEYGIDVEVPDMAHAVVVRSPVAGGVVKAIDESRALAMAGVTDVLEIPEGVAVVAERYWQAKKAAAALDVEWDLPPLAQVSQADLRRDYQALLDSEDGDSTAAEGDFAGAFDAATVTIEAEYWAPYLSHSPLEPMNAVVRVANGEAELWAGTQSPQAAAGLVARTLDIDADKVRVHQTYLGGGFGRRGTLGHIVEATRIAAATGRTVQVLWSREDDTQSGVYRPASLMRIRAGADAQGNVSAWQAKRVGSNITPGILSGTLPGLMPGMSDGMVDFITNRAAGVLDGWVVDPASIEGLFEDYDLPNREVIHATMDHGLPVTFWRSVGHSYTSFAKESAIDELAHAAGRDPVELRLANTRNNPRLANVIKTARERMGAMAHVEGRKLGFAAHASFGSYVAQAAEVSVAENKINVHRVLCVVDCGVAVNPDVVRAQMEGGVMFGLTAALYGKVELENGRVQQSNFHDYPILRMNEAPTVEVVIIDNQEAPTGVGEPGLPPIAPAVANAVFAITGRRLRSLPLTLA